MDDILRVRYSPSDCPYVLSNQSQTLSQLPHSRTSVKHVHFVESSPALRAVQEKKLQAWGDKGRLKITLARFYRGCPHGGWGIHYAGCARVLRCAPVPSHRSTLGFVDSHCQFSQKGHQSLKEVLITYTPDPAAKTILRHLDDRPPPPTDNYYLHHRRVSARSSQQNRHQCQHYSVALLPVFHLYP